MKHLTSHDEVYGLIRLFNFDSELSIQTFLSSSLLLFAALLLGVIAEVKNKAGAPYRLQWTILSAAFLFMAIDEAASIHELLDRPTREILGYQPRGVIYNPWVIPGIAVTLVFALFMLQFWLHLPWKTRVLCFVAAILYIGGAIGGEVIGGFAEQLYGSRSVIYEVLATLEESLEMAGVILFIYGLLKYIEDSYGEVRFQLNSAEDKA